jgi:hypothetical protein
MARRVLNRKQLRVEAEQAAAQAAPAGAPAAGPPAKPAKPPRAPGKPRPKKEPERLRARWGVFDNAMKLVAIFDYNQRDAAKKKAADLNAKKAGQHFLQIVKEPMVAPDGPQG